MISILQNRVAGYLLAVLGIAVVTAICAPFHDQLSNTTVALALLLVVLFVATGWGSWPAFLASLLGMLCFNFFFLPPVYTFTIADPQNWVALTAFFITAVTVGQLSARAKRRAVEAEAGRKEAWLASAYNRSLIEASLDPLVTIDRNGKITDLNPATEKLTGYSRKELMGSAFSDYFTEPEKAKTGYQHVFQEGSVHDYTLEIRHRGGQMIPVLYNASVYRDETGETVGVVAVARDITERQRAEDQIRLLARLQTVVARLGQWALRSDRYEDVLEEAVTLLAQTLGVDYCNVMELLPGGEEFLLRAGVGWKEGYVGRATVPVKGSQPGYVVRSDQPVIVHDATKETRFTPLPRLLGENVVSAMSVVISTSEGPYGALGAHTRHRRTFTSDEVNFLQAVANVLGATIERQRAEEALRESEANLNRAQEVAHIGSWYLDIAHNQLTWSDEVFRIFGVPKGAALTYEVFLSIVHPSDREYVDKAWTAALHGAPYDIEHRLVVGSKPKWVRERAQLEFDEDGNPVKGIGTAQDITERKYAEVELLRLNRTNRALSKCNQVLIRATDETSLLQQICQIIVEEAECRLCWVGSAENDEAKSVRPLAQAGFDEGYLNILNITWADTERGRGPTGTCIRTRQTVVVKNIATDSTMAPWRAEALKRGYASIIAIPLLLESTAFGALTIYAAEPEAFGAEEVALLTELADDMAFGIMTLRTRIERAKAEEEILTLNAELEQRVMARTAELQAANKLKDDLLVREQATTAELAAAREQETEIGYRIQQTLLLDQPPQDIPGLRVAALTIPSQRIDGDFYVFFKHPGVCLDVIVGDVMGKGVPAALLGAATKSHFIEALSHLMALSKNGELPDPKEIVTLAHAKIARHLITLENFVTLCYARLDLRQCTLDLVDCGHTGLIHVRGETGLCDLVHGDNLPLGIREGEIYDQLSVSFAPGDVFLFYSDGITEARNSARELFGVERLAECVRVNRGLEPEALVKVIRNAVLTFSVSDRLADDLTCVAIKAGERQLPLACAEIELRSALTDLSRAREFVRAFCHHLPGSPLDEGRVAELELAVTEVSSNIMKHAYHGRADQWIHLEAQAFPGQVLFQLHHLGDPFDPSAVPPPAFDGSRESGFGIYLITKSVDEVRYYRDERGRNCIALIKVRTP
jgi:PAS domain S-box-containing protein